MASRVHAIVRVLLVVGNVPLAAQTTLGAGAVSGYIQDESGALIAGARITLTEVTKGLARRFESSAGGSFLIPSVIAGVYSLRVEKEAFSPQLINGLKIEVGTQAAVAITLRIGGIHTAITVLAPNTIELDAESNMIGTVVYSGQVQQLPLNGRNFLQLALLVGGTKEVTTASDLFSGNVGPPARSVVLPGMLPHAVGYSLNGINVRGSQGRRARAQPVGSRRRPIQGPVELPDAGPGTASRRRKHRHQEWEQPSFMAKPIEFLRNRILDARSFFAHAREDLKRNQFGMALGGPIRKDRVWFHGFYEGLREITAFSAAGYSPTADMFAGDFAATGRIIYDPASYRSDSGTRQPFPASIVIPRAASTRWRRISCQYYLPGSSLASRPS